MKYMNHLRKLALLSSLALSYSVYADGTLPLPLTMEDPTVSLSMSVSGVSETPRKTPLVVNRLPVQACDPSDELYTATGTVSLGADGYNILGVCKSKLNPLKRKIVTADLDATRITTLDGTADDSVKFTTFSGTLTHKLLAPTGTPNGQEAETSEALAPVKFILRR